MQAFYSAQASWNRCSSRFPLQDICVGFLWKIKVEDHFLRLEIDNTLGRTLKIQHSNYGTIVGESDKLRRQLAFSSDAETNFVLNKSQRIQFPRTNPGSVINGSQIIFPAETSRSTSVWFHSSGDHVSLASLHLFKFIVIENIKN